MLKDVESAWGNVLSRAYASVLKCFETVEVRGTGAAKTTERMDKCMYKMREPARVRLNMTASRKERIL